MPDARKAKAAYRWWTLLIPVAMILIGALLFIFAGPANAFLGLFGGGLVLVGILTFSYLLIAVVAVEVAVRRLLRREISPRLLSEQETDTELPDTQTPHKKK